MKRIYLAAAWHRREEMAELAYKLKYAGFEITSRWIDEARQPSGIKLDDNGFKNVSLEDFDEETVAAEDVAA
jgi:hypothetical protein